MGVKIEAKYRSDITYSDDFSVMKVAILDRESEKVVESGEFDGKLIPSALRGQIFAQGINKKLMSDTSDVSPGPGKIAALGEVFDRLVAGKWTADRERGAPVVSAEVEGVAEAIRQPVSAVQKARTAYIADGKEAVWAALVAKCASNIEAVKARRAGGDAPLDLEAALKA